MCVLYFSIYKSAQESDRYQGMFYSEHDNGVSKTAQWVTMFTTKSNNMSSILGSYMVDRGNRLSKIVL